MPVIPFPSERVFNSATFLLRYIVPSLEISESCILIFFLIFHLIQKLHYVCM